MNYESSIGGLEKPAAKHLPSSLLCLSHLRWDFVYQRPQHLLTRLSKVFNIYFMEEPVFDATDQAYITASSRGKNLSVLTPHLPKNLSEAEANAFQKEMLNRFLENKNLEDFAFWYYTPMALQFTDHLEPGLVIYDCMDELSAFKFAPPLLKSLEKELLNKADVVFTGGNSLYQAKKNQHQNIFPFPSSIDKSHFGKARNIDRSPADQVITSQPRIGFYGVIDERFDIGLIKGIAEARPEWQIILIGPVIKINPAALPQNKNIHYLGAKSYQELPSYLSGWDVALIPFLINESTRFISPTKTPEYLAAGIPVVSTPIRDVVYPYGENGLVHIGKDAGDFIKAIDTELNSVKKEKWLSAVDAFLSQNSWDITCRKMLQKIESIKENKASLSGSIKISNF